MITIGVLLLDLKSYVKYTTLPSHMGLLMIIYSLYTAFISCVKYILSVCNVFVLKWIMAQWLQLIE